MIINKQSNLSLKYLPLIKLLKQINKYLCLFNELLMNIITFIYSISSITTLYWLQIWISSAFCFSLAYIIRLLLLLFLSYWLEFTITSFTLLLICLVRVRDESRFCCWLSLISFVWIDLFKCFNGILTIKCLYEADRIGIIFFIASKVFT